MSADQTPTPPVPPPVPQPAIPTQNSQQVEIGQLKIDKKWLKWIVLALLLVAHQKGWLDKESVGTLLSEIPMASAPEKKPEPEAQSAPPVNPVQAAPDPHIAELEKQIADLKIAQSATKAEFDPQQLLDQAQKWLAVWKQFEPIIKQIVPIINPQKPDPVIPIPGPTPDPDPVPSVVKILMIDQQNKPIPAATMNAGITFQVKSTVNPLSANWEVSSNGDVQLLKVVDEWHPLPDKSFPVISFTCTLSPGSWVEFHLLDIDTRTKATQRITCNQGGQPPPDVPVVVNPVDPVVPVVPVVPQTVGYPELIAKEAEDANTKASLLASEVVDGTLTFAVQGGMPKSVADAIRAAVPAIGKLPARDLTPEEVAKIRSVK